MVRIGAEGQGTQRTVEGIREQWWNQGEQFLNVVKIKSISPTHISCFLQVVEMKIQMNAVKAENCLLQNRQRKHEEIIANLSKKVVHKKDLAEFIHTHLKPHLTLGQVKAYLRGNTFGLGIFE